jgi:hypothetical protein
MDTEAVCDLCHERLATHAVPRRCDECWELRQRFLSRISEYAASPEHDAEREAELDFERRGS